MSVWVIRDERPLDPDVVARAAAAQASLAQLLERLRAADLPAGPCPGGEEVPPWPT